MNPPLATAVRHEMEAARAAGGAGDPDADFGLLALGGIVGAME